MLAEEKLISLQEPVARICLEFNVGVLPLDIHVQDRCPVRVMMTQQAPTFGQTFTAAETAPCLPLEVSHLRADCPPQVVGLWDFAGRTLVLCHI